MTLHTEEVWDGFVLLSLLDDHAHCSMHLVVPHNSDQKDQFSHTMRDHTQWIIIHGQEELPHACDTCICLFTMPDGTILKTKVVVTDGVTIGRPCCAFLHCTNLLVSIRHRFCSVDPAHRHLESVCAVDRCDRAVLQDGHTIHKACDDPLHQRMERLNLESLHSGKRRSQQERVAKLNDMVVPLPDPPSVAVQEGDEWYEHDERNGDLHGTSSMQSQILYPNE